MPRFFVGPENINERSAVITGDDAAHISRSLRMKGGEGLTLCDASGTEYDCRIVTAAADEVVLEVISSHRSENEPPYRATVYQSLVKGERFDTVIQKSVESGAVRIVPVLTQRATVRLTRADAEKKRARWQRIAEEAAKQCGRAAIPEIGALMTFREAISTGGVRLFCYEGERCVSLRGALAGSAPEGEIGIFIGPEGGYSPEEAEEAAAAGAVSVSLGKRILRTESAAPFVLACLSYEYEL